MLEMKKSDWGENSKEEGQHMYGTWIGEGWGNKGLDKIFSW